MSSAFSLTILYYYILYSIEKGKMQKICIVYFYANFTRTHLPIPKGQKKLYCTYKWQKKMTNLNSSNVLRFYFY